MNKTILYKSRELRLTDWLIDWLIGVQRHVNTARSMCQSATRASLVQVADEKQCITWHVINGNITSITLQLHNCNIRLSNHVTYLLDYYVSTYNTESQISLTFDSFTQCGCSLASCQRPAIYHCYDWHMARYQICIINIITNIKCHRILSWVTSSYFPVKWFQWQSIQLSPYHTRWVLTFEENIKSKLEDIIYLIGVIVDVETWLIDWVLNGTSAQKD